MRAIDFISELYEPESSFPLNWYPSHHPSEASARAYDRNKGYIDIKFTPILGSDDMVEVEFSRNDSYDMTGGGDANRVLGTVLQAFREYLQGYQPKILVFSAKGASRSKVYQNLIKRFASTVGYKQFDISKLSPETQEKIAFSGSDLMVLRKSVVDEDTTTESTSPTITIKDAKKILSAMGFKPTGRKKGSHDIWKDSLGILFTVPLFGKDLEYGVTKNLLRLMKNKGVSINSTTVSEMAGEIHGGVRKALIDQGYKYLGSGIDKQAYLEPSTGQALIIFGYRKNIDDFSPDQRMFIDWIKYCNANKNNPNLPKFSGFESFQFYGKNYIQARMEPLQEVTDQVKNIVNYLETVIDEISQGDINAAFEYLAKKGYYDEKIDYFKPYTVKQVVDYLGGLKRAKNLLQTVHDVAMFGAKNRYNIDLHSGNYMQRSDGTIVVNDPFVIWLRSE